MTTVISHFKKKNPEVTEAKLSLWEGTTYTCIFKDDNLKPSTENNFQLLKYFFQHTSIFKLSLLVCLCAQGEREGMPCMWRSQRNTMELLLSCHWGPRDQSLVKCLYPVSHFNSLKHPLLCKHHVIKVSNSIRELLKQNSTYHALNKSKIVFDTSPLSNPTEIQILLFPELFLCFKKNSLIEH